MPAPRAVLSGLRHLATALLALTTVAACTQPAAGTGELARQPAPSSAPTLTSIRTPTLRPTVPVRSTPTPTPTPDPSASTPSRTIRPTVTLHPPTIRPPRGDLQIHLVGRDCGFYSDTGGGLWLNPTLAVTWTGPGAFPGTNLGFSMTTNYGKATAGGPVHNTNPFTWAIGGENAVGNAWLGHTVKITVTIDPGNDVPETNEGNNVTVITVNVPATLPFSPTGSNSDYTILCLTA